MSKMLTRVKMNKMLRENHRYALGCLVRKWAHHIPKHPEQFWETRTITNNNNNNNPKKKKKGKKTNRQ